MTLRVDKDWLEKRIGKDKTSALLSSSNNHPILTIDDDRRGSSRMTDSSNNRLKYGNHKTFCNTLQKWIDSKGEHRYLHILMDFEKQGFISDLKHDSHHNLEVNGEKICRLELDYEFNWLNKVRYADFKSKATLPPGFRLKVKLFEAIYQEPVHIIFPNKTSIVTEIIDFNKKRN